MVTLLLAAAYFAALYLGKRTKLRLLHQQVLRCSKRIFGVPEFRFYAVAETSHLFAPDLGWEYVDD